MWGKWVWGGAAVADVCVRGGGTPAVVGPFAAVCGGVPDSLQPLHIRVMRP